MSVELRRWFGLLELYVVVDAWKPWYRTFNRKMNPNGSLKRGYGVWIVDRALFEKWHER